MVHVLKFQTCVLQGEKYIFLPLFMNILRKKSKTEEKATGNCVLFSKSY